MRDDGMSNAEIAQAVGVSNGYIHKLIGRQPAEITAKNRSAGRFKQAETEKRAVERGYTVERKMMSFKPQREEPEPAKAVLVMKTLPPAPIPLHGAFMDYTISADRQTIEVENETGRVLICVPAEKLGTFIEELQAIEKNIAAEKPMPFWG